MLNISTSNSLFKNEELYPFLNNTKLYANVEVFRCYLQLLAFKSLQCFCLLRESESPTVGERGAQLMGVDFHFEPYHVSMIATDLSSQFMTHITTAVYLGLLGASPYILLELFRFISPALYDNERRYSVQVAVVVYVLFVVGVLMSYFVLFPISFRFLGTYSVSERVVSNITIDSYVSTFTTLTLTMGLVFQLPVIAFFLTKLGFVSSSMLTRYRRHAFLLIMVVAAVITPPDLMTLILVTIPLYLLYELSVQIVKRVERG